MPRLRRYRLFIPLAVLLLFLLWRVGQTDDWTDSTSPAAIFEKYKAHAHGESPQPPHRQDAKQQQHHGNTSGGGAAKAGHKDNGNGTGSKPVRPPKYWEDDESDALVVVPTTRRLPELKTSLEYPGTYALPVPTPAATKAQPPPPYDTYTEEATKPMQTQAPAIPERPPSKVEDIYAEPKEDRVHAQNPPGDRQRPAVVVPTSTVVHWHKVPEHFPVPTESLIRLPTGKPRTDIPKVQFDFKKRGAESSSVKEKRTARLDEVRREMKRAWDGYRKHAWMHDELSPVSGAFRDPFCGWAATLVDALDTLWIMGLRKEFDEAVTAVGKIDFTTTPYREEIPVFETTIRYLGGLLSAYDMATTADKSGSLSGNGTVGAGANYTILLTKATELAEILMGVFDTPNRMPILYYNWKPAHASQPQRARHVSVAEVGSLLMEFTRLSQLTGEARYYDAVARITDAFEALQNRGTTLDGIFPESLDASGCNRTAPQMRAAASASAAAERAAKEAEQSAAAAAAAAAVATPAPAPAPPPANADGDPEGYVPGWVEQSGNNNKPKNHAAAAADKPDLEFRVVPGAGGQPARGEFHALKDDGKEKKAAAAKRAVQKRDGDVAKNEVWSTNRPLGREATENSATAATIPLVSYGHVQRGEGPPFNKDGSTVDYECDHQPALIPGGYGLESYSMGGSQDSTYEYFPKQFLLLGGLEPKYRVMHQKVVAAVKKYLLYRPMVPGNRDILFSAKVSTKGDPEKDAIYEYEATHLTCFLGGMFALGGKIFPSSDDLAIAARLTDGCVWAYESMPSGIMPEGALVVPCPRADDCRWNETVWHRYLDPSWETRDAEVATWMANQKVLLLEEAKKKAEEERQRKEEEEKRKADERRKAAAAQAAASAADARAEAAAREDAKANNGSMPAGVNVNLDLTAAKPEAKVVDHRQHQKRDAPPPSSKEAAAAARERKTEDELAAQSELKGREAAAGAAAKSTIPAPSPGTGSGATGGTVAQAPLTPEELASLPYVPPTHAEFVESRVKNERLPKGWVSLNWRKYILRPEAIESVFYMYRVTGDSAWQDKGWAMWQAIMKHTRTEHGHSAIDDVGIPDPRQVDEMESFWLAETLKYFYLLYAEPDVVSLDEWVLNTEAHPFRRPR